MYKFPDSKEKLKKRISLYKSVLNREKRERGYISDRSGKRYLLFWLYFALDDPNKTCEHFRWYNTEFPYDIGEPGQKFCWAMTLFRLNHINGASKMLADTMYANLYLIPHVIGLEVEEFDIWHADNYESTAYLDYFPDRIIDCLRKDEIDWIKETYNSKNFQDLRTQHIEILHELLDTHDSSTRSKLFDESYQLLENLKNSNSNMTVLP